MQQINQALAPGSIRLQQSCSNWQEAIVLAGDALVASGRTTAEYTQAIIEGFEEFGPYSVLAEGIALVHARPSSAVLSAGLSLVTLTSPVDFGSDRFGPVSLVLGLAAADHDGHIDLMANLSELLMNKSIIDTILSVQNENQLRAIFG